MNNSLVDIKMEGECVTRNGVTRIARIRVSQKGDAVTVGFVSQRLKRSLHSGFTTTASELDEFCVEWLKARAGGCPLNAAADAILDIMELAQVVLQKADFVNRAIRRTR